MTNFIMDVLDDSLENKGLGCAYCRPRNSYPELENILRNKNISTLFQPIICLQDGSTFAYEALSRAPKSSVLHMPEELFAAAREHGRLYELDNLCREKTILAFAELGVAGKLSINIDPHSLLDPRFEQEGHTLGLLREAGIANNQIILELTEHTRADCYEALSRAVTHYRKMGFTIALDDLGAGYSNLRLMAELEPEYIKLDKYFISALSKNKKSYDFMHVIVKLASKIDCKVIAEGVETSEDLQVVCELGIDYAQGYFLGRPHAHPNHAVADIFTNTTLHCQPQKSVKRVDVAAVHIESVHLLSLLYTEACSPDMFVSPVLKRFQSDASLRAIPVVESSKVVGLLERDSILQLFSATFSHSLNYKKKVRAFMHKEPALLQLSDALTDVSEKAMNRSDTLVYTPMIVCNEKGDYVGMVPIRELLEKITQSQIKHARQCSPLTGLPGNISIDSEISQRLHQGEWFVCCYFDLDNFKAFNDAYGFERGDLMICFLANLLEKYQQANDFIGHIGGDDFIFITSRQGWQKGVEDCLQDFEKNVVSLYDKEDQIRGGIGGINRQGEQQNIAFSSLSVGALPCLPHRFGSQLEVSSALFQLKHLAKAKAGNSLVIERRQS